MANQPDQNDAEPPEGNGSRQEPPPGLFERAASWLSMLLIAGVIGFLVWEGFATDDPPELDVQPIEMRATEGRYYVTLEVRNAGDVSIRNVGIRAELLSDDEAVAASTVGVEWLPAHSTRRTVAVFDRDPGGYQLEVRVEGYELP